MMAVGEVKLWRYMEEVTGQKPDCQPVDPGKLPLFLRERFALCEAGILGRRWSLALEKGGRKPGTPADYERQTGLLRQHLSAPPVLVVSSLPANTRNRLVRRGVPFIVPGNQMFLPMVCVDLREHFFRPPGPARGRLTPTAQRAVLYHLQRGSLGGIPLCDVAEKIGCSRMMASNVKNELVGAGLCTGMRAGRSMVLHFPTDRRALWDLAKNRLGSPVRQVHWVRWGAPGGPGALLAGLSALARATPLADDRLPTHAVGPGVLESWLEKGMAVRCPDDEEADARLEVWSYDPDRLGGAGAVDPLSLHTSLWHDPDERVRQALEILMETVAW